MKDFRQNVIMHWDFAHREKGPEIRSLQKTSFGTNVAVVMLCLIVVLLH